MNGLLVDLFAGGGGASVGIEAATRSTVDIALNHSPIALAVHRLNHPTTRHVQANVFEVDPHEAVGDEPVQLLWASPDCTHFSIAKGDVPRSRGIRSLAWVVVEWAEKVRPNIICVENVREFESWGPLCERGRPIKNLAGTEFAAWVEALETAGYVVEWQVLDAAQYGAPTRRKRLFIVARRDGLPIQWPLPTHGAAPGLLPEVPAHTIIDWSLPCPSIFERDKPLADKTQRRIAEGIKRYVIESAKPYIVNLSHGGRVEDLDSPMRTITAGPKGGDRALVAPTFAVTGNSERSGQAPRANDPRAPFRTVTATGSQGAVVAAWLAKHYGGVVGHDLHRPIGTVTGTDHHSIAAATLVGFRGTSDSHKGTLDIREPLPTITAGGNHVAEVRAFLTAYYSSGSVGQSLHKPLRTVTAKARLGIVTVRGTDYQIIDIGMRMLEPHELLAAQFGKFAARYDLEAQKAVGGKLRPLSKADKVRLIGNSVCPEVAEALVAAQYAAQTEEAAA